MKRAASHVLLEANHARNPIVQYWTEQATNELAREYILKALDARLQLDAARIFKPTLEAIDDVQRLDELHHAAVLADSVEDFRRALAANDS